MTLVSNRSLSNRLLLALAVGLVGCAHIVTDPVGDDTVGGDTPAGDTVAVCEPLCPEGLGCEDGMCRAEDAEGFGGWYRPGPDSGAEMVRIPGGEFWMGCDEGAEPGCPEESRPKVSVHLTSPYYLDRFEVTNARYREYLLADGITASAPTCTGYDLWDDSNPQDPAVPDWAREHPVACVSAADAAAFCAWAGKTLPTEAQWELGARGQTGRVYPWGDDFISANAQCYHDWEPQAYKSDFQCKDVYPEGTACPDEGPQGTVECHTTAPVTVPAPNNAAWNLQHMAGNVAEWVADAWTEDHSVCETAGVLGCTDPVYDPEAGDKRPVRGGSWFEQDHDELTGWFREDEDAKTKKKDIGFRCAWTPGD